MTTRVYALLALLLVPLAPVLAGELAKNPDFPLERSVRMAVERSPDDFVMGLFRVGGPVHCEGETCWIEMRPVEVFAQKGREEGAGRKIVRLMTSGEAGDSRGEDEILGILTPVKPELSVYAGTYLNSDASEAEVDRLREAVQRVLGEMESDR